MSILFHYGYFNAIEFSAYSFIHLHLQCSCTFTFTFSHLADAFIPKRRTRERTVKLFHWFLFFSLSHTATVHVHWCCFIVMMYKHDFNSQLPRARRALRALSSISLQNVLSICGMKLTRSSVKTKITYICISPTVVSFPLFKEKCLCSVLYSCT